MKGLLAEIVLNALKADDNAHYDQFLNSLVNALEEEVDLGLSNNSKVEIEDIYGILVDAIIDRTSVFELCGTSGESLHENTARYHLNGKFDLASAEQVRNSLL